MPSWSWLSVPLVVGGRLDDALVPRLLSEHGIACVVDLRSELQDDPRLFERHGLELLLLPTDDHHAVADEQLARGVRWVEARLSLGKKVYIHCEHGIGRSILLSCCVLVAQGQSALDALTHIKAQRACASPSPAQLHALLRFARSYRDEQASWDELADVAYAHVPGRSPAVRAR